MAALDQLPRTDGELTDYSADRNFTWRGRTLGDLIDRVSQWYGTQLRETAGTSMPAGGLSDFGTPSEASVRGQIAVYYVNGMSTDPSEHRGASRLLATLIGRKVTGIYNLTGNVISDVVQNVLNAIPAVRLVSAVAPRWTAPYFAAVSNPIADIAQCIGDQVLPIGRTGLPLLPALSVLRAAIGESGLRDLFSMVLSAQNAATGKLFEMMYSAGSQGHKMLLVTHSQGNLIADNALWALFHVRPTAMSKMYVIGLASPAASWPARGDSRGFHLELIRDPRDPVPLISMPAAGQQPIVRQSPGQHGTHLGVGLYISTHDVERHLLMPEFQTKLKVWAAMN